MLTATITERNVENVKKLIEEVINTGKLNLCDRYLSAERIDYTDYGLPPGMANGNEGFKRVLGPFIEAFPDFRLDVQFAVTDEDRTVLYVSTSGTHKGQFMGAAPTGRKFKVNGADIFRFNDEGKVIAHWGVFDTFGMLAQLGLLPPAGQPSTAS